MGMRIHGHLRSVKPDDPRAGEIDGTIAALVRNSLRAL
jgi:hypothetical protein